MAYQEILSSLKTSIKSGIQAGSVLDVDTHYVPFYSLPNHRRWIMDFQKENTNSLTTPVREVGIQTREYQTQKKCNHSYYHI